MTANQDQTLVNTFQNIQSDPSSSQIVEPVRYHTAVTPTRPPILTQQIMADFQLLLEAWNKLSSLINEMAETNKHLKKQSKETNKHTKMIS